MIVLPPIIGFALFFCCTHSPGQWTKATGELLRGGHAAYHKQSLILTVAGLGLAALIFVLRDSVSVTQGMMATSFITLSVLTVPHMLVPWIVAKWAADRNF